MQFNGDNTVVEHLREVLQVCQAFTKRLKSELPLSKRFYN
jgi:hypothetical protein